MGNDFNEKGLKSELIILILITNEKNLNHDSREINRLIMLHVTKKCWGPFTLTKHKLEREMSEIPGEPKHSWKWLSFSDFLTIKKSFVSIKKQRNSWTGDKQFSPAIVWQLSTATSAAPPHFFLLKEIGSVSFRNSRFNLLLIYYQIPLFEVCLYVRKFNH